MALKVDTPGQNTGQRPVGNNDYRAGMVAALDSLGNAVLAGTEAAAGTVGPRNEAIGLFGEDHLTTSLEQTAQALEQIVLTSGVAVALAHDNIVASSQRVVLASNGTLLTVNVDYSINNAVASITSLGTQPNGTVVQVTYTFPLDTTATKNFRGVNFKGSLDEAEGSGKSTVWEGFGQYQTDQYVTSQAYKVGDKLRYTHSSHAFGAGFLTNEVGGSTVVDAPVGRVTAVPTASNPFLGFDFVAPAAVGGI